MLTTLLDLVAVVALAVFAFVVWPPLALLVLALAAALISYRLSRRPQVRG